MKSVVRGNPYPVVVFRDVNGAVVTPQSANLYVSYYAKGRRQSDTLAMTQSQTGNTWSATWDTTKAETGCIHWSARATSPGAAVDGSFMLEGNDANPGPQGSPDPGGYPYFM